MRLAFVAFVFALVFAAGACGDSTDIAGTYIGNATYTRADGTTGAGSATVVVADESGNVIDVDIGSACPLIAIEIKQITIDDRSGYSHFVLTSEAFTSGAACTLPDGAIAVSTGFLVVDAGLTMTLDVGGEGSGSDYVVYNFAGAQ
jgi:hypothetical protein